MNAQFICLLLFLNLVTGFDNRRCLLHMGMCVAHCPRNMHPYHTRCDGQTLSQRTCDDRDLYVIGYTCGWSRCDCNGDLLLDESTGTCVKPEVCTDLPEVLRKKMRENRERKRGRRLRMSKKIKITEDELAQIT